MTKIHIAMTTVLVTAVTAFADPPTLIALDEDVETSVAGISGDGSTVIGVRIESDGSATGFRWTADGGMVVLATLVRGDQAAPFAVSHDGSFVAGSSGQLTTTTQAVRWGPRNSAQSLGDLDPAINGLSEGWGISADGSRVVGIADACMCGMSGQAFSWMEGTEVMFGLGWLETVGQYSRAAAVSADGSIVVGVSGPLGMRQAFRYTDMTGMQPLGDLPGGGMDGRAEAISADGSTIVGTGLTDTGYSGFRWTEDDLMVPLGDLPGGLEFSEALAVNTDGSIIVGFAETAVGSEACIWLGLEIGSMDQMLIERGVASTGWTLTRASGVSANGQVMVGDGLFEGQPRSWIAYLPTCSGDTNGDGQVGVGDLANVIVDWGAGQMGGDLDSDGNVDVHDLLEVIIHWGLCE